MLLRESRRAVARFAARLPFRLAVFAVVASLAGLPCTQGEGAAEPIELGHGLTYLRVTDLDDTLGVVHAGLAKLPLVLDLRRAAATPAAAAQLAMWLQVAVLPADGLVFVLLSTETPPVLGLAIPASPRLLTLGVAGDGCAPRLAVDIDPAQDRAACNALAAGVPLPQLIEEKIAKRRFDEALLARTRANGADDAGAIDAPLRSSPPATSPPPEPAAPAAPAAATAPLPKPPLRDVVLQRAVFLHRALLALGRLPAAS